MTGDEAQRAMGRVAAHWPHVSLTSAQLDTWRDVLRRFELAEALAVLDLLRAGEFQRFAPDAGHVLVCLQARARRRARQAAEERGTDGAAGSVGSSQEALEWVARCRQMLGGSR